MSSDHLQLSEAFELLREELAFAIVDKHKAIGCEVRVSADEHLEFTIESTSKNEPSAQVRALVEARGFKIERVNDRFHFGPEMGQKFNYYRIFCGGLDVKTAAREAIELFLLISGQAREAWLWLTAENYADRGDPMPPTVWPSANNGH